MRRGRIWSESKYDWKTCLSHDSKISTIYCWERCRTPRFGDVVRLRQCSMTQPQTSLDLLCRSRTEPSSLCRAYAQCPECSQRAQPMGRRHGSVPERPGTSLHRPIQSRCDRAASGYPWTAKDDNATRGLYPWQHILYCRTLSSFSRQQASSYDVVLEKGWRLSGYLLDGFRRKGVPGVLIENDVRFWTEPLTNLQAIAKYILHSTAHWVAGRCSRRAPAVIAETQELKTMLVKQRELSPDQMEVVGLGVDHALFRSDGSTIRSQGFSNLSRYDPPALCWRHG